MEAAELRQGAVPRQLPPRPDPPAARGSTRPRSRRARRSSPSSRASSRTRSTRSRSSATRRSPTDVIEGLKEIGALGMKIPTEYGGLGLSQVYYNKALALAGVWHSALSTLLSAHQSIGLPQPLMLFGTDEQKARVAAEARPYHISAFLLTEPDVGSDPARLSVTATPVRTARLHAQRHQAVGHERRVRRRRRRDGDGAEERGPPRRDHRVHRAVRHTRASRSSTATRSWGCAGSRTP